MVDLSIQVDENSQPETVECVTQSTSISVQTNKITGSYLFSDPYIHNDDEKVLFYTGLPNYATLLLVLEFVTSAITAPRGVLSLFKNCL